MARTASLALRVGPGHPSSTALRALRVLEEVRANASPLSVTDVAQRIGIDRAVAYRMLVTLFNAGYLLRDGSGRRYRLSHKLLSLSRHLLIESRRTELVRECLDDLAAQTLESVHYSLLEGMETVLVQRAKGRQFVSVNFEIGERSRLHYTAIGKAVLAFQDSAFIERVIVSGLPRLAARTITERRRPARGMRTRPRPGLRLRRHRVRRRHAAASPSRCSSRAARSRAASAYRARSRASTTPSSTHFAIAC